MVGMCALMGNLPFGTSVSLTLFTIFPEESRSTLASSCLVITICSILALAELDAIFSKKSHWTSLNINSLLEKAL